MEDVIRLDRCCFSSDWINSLGATGGQNGFPLVEGDPGFLSAGGSEKGLEAFAQRTASSVIVLHCPVLDLLAESYKISGYSTALANSNSYKIQEFIYKFWLVL